MRLLRRKRKWRKRHKHHWTAQHISKLSGSTLWLESCKIRADWFSLSRPAAVTWAEMMISDECTSAFAAPEKEKPSGLQMIILGQRQMWYAYGNFWGLSRLSNSSMTRVNCKRAESRAWSCLVICPFLSQGFIDVGQRAPKNMSFALFLLLTSESSPLKMTSPLLIWAHIWSGYVELCAGYYWSEHGLLLG